MKGGLGYLGVAYSAVWIGIAAYLGVLWRRQRALQRRLDDLGPRHRGPRQ